MQAEYRVLPMYPLYKVYSDGTVIRVQRKTINGMMLKERKLVASKAKNGYLTVRLYSTMGVYKTFYLHRLVWEAFNGEILSGTEICHRNCNREDCSLENLYATNHKENCNNPTSLENYRKANAIEKGKYDRKRLEKAMTKEYEQKLIRTYMFIRTHEGDCGVWRLMRQGHCGYPRACKIVAEMRGKYDNLAVS